jgi:hypothetical protein
MLGDSLSSFFRSSLAATLERFAVFPYGGNAVVEETVADRKASGVLLSAGKVDSRITEQRAQFRRRHVLSGRISGPKGAIKGRPSGHSG